MAFYKPKHMRIEPDNGRTQITMVRSQHGTALRRMRPVMSFCMPVDIWGSSHFNIEAYACYNYEEDEKI